MVNPKLYERYISNKLLLDEYRIERFRIPLENQSRQDLKLASEINKIFVEFANMKVRLLPGARDVLILAKSRGLKLGLLTNGPSDGQRRKLSILGIEQYFDVICISEEVGFGKPTQRAFENICNLLGCRPADCLMVGDSLSIDIDPARALGLITFQISEPEPNKVISNASGSLEELYRKLAAS